MGHLIPVAIVFLNNHQTSEGRFVLHKIFPETSTEGFAKDLLQQEPEMDFLDQEADFRDHSNIYYFKEIIDKYLDNVFLKLNEKASYIR